MTPDHLAELALIELSRAQREAVMNTVPLILKRENVVRIGVERK